MINRNMKIVLCGASAMGLVLTAHPAFAQAGASTSAANESAGDEIIVTARRASESYIDVPVQVTVQSPEALNRSGANDLAKIAENVPFVQITKTSSGSGGAFVVRGIGSFATDVGISQPVLLNMDNVFVGRPRIIAQGQYDIGQVEVLKGPQALFYGKNSPAGVVSITSKDPADHFEGYARASYEFNADERIFEGAISVPLADTLAVRFAGRGSAMKGWLKNNSTGYANNPLAAVAPFLAPFPVPGSATGRSPATDDAGGRVTVKWTPVSGLTAKLKYAYGISHGDGDNSANEVFCDPKRATSISVSGVTDVQADCLANGINNHSGFPVGLTVNYPLANGGQPYATTKSHLLSFNLDYDFDTFSISSITGYYKLKYRGAQNAYHDGLGNNWSAQSEDSSGFSEELRLSSKFDGPINFVLGMYYGDQKQLNHSYSYVFNAGQDPVSLRYFSYDRLTDQKTKTWSGFGQLRYAVTEQIELSGGVRYTNEKKTDINGNAWVNPLVNSANPLVRTNLRPQGDYFNRGRTFTDWSPEVTARWKPAPGQILYATYKQGYKSGGFSAPPVLTSSFTDAGTRFDPEKSRGFEIGYKGELLDRRLRVELVAYSFTYSSQQVSVFVPASLGFLVSNAGKSKVQGVEGSLNWQVVPGLNLSASLGYNDAHFITYTGAACWTGQVTIGTGCVATGVGTSTAQDLSGVQLPRAPKWAGNFGVDYEGPIGAGLKVKLYGGGLFSSSYNTSDNNDPFLRQGSYVKFNGSIGLASEDDKYELTLIGRNLTNEYTMAYGQDKARGRAGELVGYFGRKREITLQGTVRF